MKIVCDSCGTKYSISDDKVRGKVFKIRCKKCSHIIVVRGTNDAAAAPAAAAEGGWHLVVDGEQVGPLPETDIRGKLERNEINGDTYVWKEGFADWIKLSTVPEFSDLAGGGRASSPEMVAEPSAPVATNGTEGSGASGRHRSGPSGLFGGVAAQVTAGNDSDVFAAPAPAAARGGGGDLFASSAARPAAQATAEEPRWPATSAAANHGGGGAAAAGHDGGRVESLTGQRHENSVLFSLSNLQSLAMPSAASKPLSTTAPTSEGSGLIDIRAMAATTLGAPGDARGGFGGGGADDLPAFGAFSPAAPVLLLPTSSGPPKWVYPVIIGMAVLLVGIGVVVYKLFNEKPTVITQTVAAPAPAAPAAVPPPSGAVAAAVPSKPSTIPDENLPPREAPKAEGGKPEAKADGKGERHHAGGGHHADKGEKDKKGADEKKVVAAAAAAPEPAEKKPAKGSIDDLLEGALNKRGGSSSRARDDDAPSRKAAEPAAPAGPLSKGAIVAGMNGVRGKVNECYSQYKVPGTAMVNVVIGKNGKISSATVTGKFAGTPTGACVEKAVKTASFPPSDGLSTPYPFLLK
jgi:predicted Zn finger-like uncharacterized protein